VEFTTLFDYLQLLRAIAKTLQVCTIGSADVGHDILMPAPFLAPGMRPRRHVLAGCRRVGFLRAMVMTPDGAPFHDSRCENLG
jgi:hypothetical protein